MQRKTLPNIKVIYLIIAAELIEIIFFVLVAAGIEKMPQVDKPPFSPYSHSIIMGITWSIVAVIFTFLISKNKKTAIIIGLLVLSHTILDFIASPKLAFYPTDTKLPVFFNDSITFGLGLFSHKTIALISEFGFIVAGILIYILSIRRKKAQPTSL